MSPRVPARHLGAVEDGDPGWPRWVPLGITEQPRVFIRVRLSFVLEICRRTCHVTNENVAVPVVAWAVVRDIVILGVTQLPVTLLVRGSFPLSAAV